MLLFVAALLLSAVLIYSLRGSMTAGGPVVWTGFNGVSVVALFAAFVAAGAAGGTAFGLSLIAALMLNEAGRVLAYRLAGHERTRFRLVPLLDRVPVSDQPLRSEGEAFFISLMGAGFSLAPMVLALTFAVLLVPTMPEAAAALRVFAVTCGLFNLVALLPFWPLDGGRCVRLAAGTFWPALAPAMTAFTCGMLASASLRTGSLALMVVAAAGAHSMLRGPSQRLRPLGPDAGLIALAAYTFTFAAHFSAAWLILQDYF